MKERFEIELDYWGLERKEDNQTRLNDILQKEPNSMVIKAAKNMWTKAKNWDLLADIEDGKISVT